MMQAMGGAGGLGGGLGGLGGLGSPGGGAGAGGPPPEERYAQQLEQMQVSTASLLMRSGLISELMLSTPLPGHGIHGWREELAGFVDQWR